MNPNERPACVVAGGGVAGLLAAAAARHLGPVVVVEPDPVDAWSRGARSGVPHGRQLHNLLGRGQRHLEELVPGVLAALADAGAVRGSVSSDTFVVEHGQRMPRRDVGLAIWSVTRQVLEEVLAGLVLGDGVTRRTGAVIGLEAVPGGVRGAVVHDESGTSVLPTHLVVDATGRRAAATRWAFDASLPVPTTTSVTTRQWYASVVVETQSYDAAMFAMVFPTARCPYGGLVSPAGDGRVRVSLNGSVGPPPRTFDEVLAIAAQLEDAVVAHALGHVPTEVHAFGAPQAVWRRYDLLPNPVPGLLPLGDAVAHLAPLFGQGVSGAAWEAAGLASALRSDGSVDEATRAHLGHTGHVRRTMWDLMTVQDPGAPGDLDQRQSELLVERLVEDPSAHWWYVRMWHLLAPLDVLPALVRGGFVDEAAWSRWVGGAA